MFNESKHGENQTTRTENESNHFSYGLPILT